MTRSISMMLSLLLFGAGGAALAQTAYDPAIAYTQLQGRSVYLYVANADGSHAVRLASAANINAVDMAPGGGRLAYSSNEGLRVVDYTASNSGVMVTATTLLVGGGPVSSPDFSSDGSRLVYYRSGAFRAIASAGGAEKLLYTSSAGTGGFAIHWLRPQEMGNAFAFLTPVAHGPNIPVDYEIRVVLLDQNDQITSVSTVISTASQAFKAIDDFDVARTRNALLVTANFPTAIRFLDYDLGTAQLVDRGGNGNRGHYEAGDAAILCREQVKGGSFVSRLSVSGGGLTRLTAKGDFGAIDARP